MSLTQYPNEKYNSWITVSDANIYFEGRLYSDEWKNSTDKEKALLHAFRELNMLNLEIDLKRNAAALSQLQKAQCEQALHLLQNSPIEPTLTDVSVVPGGVAIKMTENKQGQYSLEAMKLLTNFITIKNISRFR